MFRPLSRRRFVTGTAAAGALTALGNFDFLGRLPAAEKPSNKVPLASDIEPLVRLIEDTPREKVLEAVAAKVRAGTSYHQLLSAVMLAGVRGIKPRPVGFQFHAVLVINSAHLASLAATDQDRWLPLFWAVDNFKNSQATNAKQNAGWTMPALDDSKVPTADVARKRFTEAMDAWDVEAADVAAAGLARTVSANEAFEIFAPYGMRDFRDIGHKAIFVANSWRALQTIGWRHAEPILRSLTFALLDHGSEPNPAKSDLDADRPGRENVKRAADAGPLVRSRQRVDENPQAMTSVLANLREGDAANASVTVARLLNTGANLTHVWDAIFLMGGELLMRQPGIVGLHTLTSANALHFAYQTSANETTRKMALLQAAAFMPMFRDAMIKRGPKLADLSITALTGEGAKPKAAEAIEDILANPRKDRLKAAQKTLSLVQTEPSAVEPLMAAARRLIFAKGNDSHDYKFSSAVLEDYYNISPMNRGRFLAAAMFNLRGAGETDNGLIRRTRDALAKG